MKKALVLMLMALMFVACGSAPQPIGVVLPPTWTPNAEGGYAPTSAPSPTSWLPSGFQVAGDGLGVRWLDDNEFSCSYSSGHCWGLEVITRDGCQDLYAEITILNSNRVNIGWTNDTASGIRPMEKVQLIFDTFEDSAHYARLSELNCY